MLLIDERDQWKTHHRLRHRASIKAFRWLSRKNIIKARPGERFRIQRHTVRIAGLPGELAGLTIAHLSDLHVGTIIRPEFLPSIVDKINAIGADLIANTGDLIDHDNQYLAPTVEALAGLEAPLGVYHVLGNHDYRDDGPAVIDALRAAQLNVLVNEHHRVAHRGRHIAVAGIDWAQHPVNIAHLVDHACGQANGDDFKLLLAHHPHALDPAAEHGVHLVLAGHTHGGQFVFRKNRHGRESIGLGNFKFRYAQGHYTRHRTHLYVTSGLGGSFPLRFRCPAEVGVLELHPA